VTALATWWCQATPGTTYVRAEIPAKFLPGNVVELKTHSLQEDENGEAFLVGQHGSASIWQFPGNATRGILMAELQSQGFKVMVEVDDNYLSPPPRIPGLLSDWATYLDRDGSTDRHSFQAHARIAKWCDGIIVTTEVLAESYRGVHDDVFVCPNSVDLTDWDPWEDRAEGPVRVGYAGSDSHRYDLADITDALDWAHRDGADLVKMGAGVAEWRWPHTQVPWTNNPREYRQNLRQAFDIGLCPLRRGEWQDGKSDLKVLEYLSAGILPVVQADSPVYTEWVPLLPHASTSKQWKKVVRELVALDEVGRNAIFNDAYAYMLERKTIEANIHKWREAVS